MEDVSLFYVAGGDAKVVGDETRRIYWFRAGKPTLVHPDDAEILLEKTVTRSCCGTSVERTMNPFQTE